MELQVYQIDALAEAGGGWTYNNSIPICKVSIKGDPTPRKILKALYDKNLLVYPHAVGKFKVDDYFSYEGTWCVQRRSNSEPVFDLIELK